MDYKKIPNYELSARDSIQIKDTVWLKVIELKKYTNKQQQET